MATYLTTIETHTCGHPTRIVVGGLPMFDGDSVADKRTHARRDHDGLRTLLCCEPRGHEGMYVAYVVPSEIADVGIIFASQVGYDDMCGHGLIGVVTGLFESGWLPHKNIVRLETPAGIVIAQAHWNGQRVSEVSFKSVPAFLYERDVTVIVPKFGKIKGDLAFGGNWFLYVDINKIESGMKERSIISMLRLGGAIKREVNRAIQIRHPEQPSIAQNLLGISFYGLPLKHENSHQANLVVESETFYDRSPCGTGTCGRMAVLYCLGELLIGEEFRNEGIAGGVFRGVASGITKVGPLPAIRPQLTGSASITGQGKWRLDDYDILGASGWTGS